MSDQNLYGLSVSGSEANEALVFTAGALDTMNFDISGVTEDAYVPVKMANGGTAGAYVITGSMLPVTESSSSPTIPTAYLLTSKVNDLMACDIVRVTMTSVSSLPASYTIPPGYVMPINADLELIHAVLSNPAAQAGDWTVTTALQSVTVDGTINGTTDITLYLAKPRYTYST